ncbi:MAG TPA: hypothetical protein VGK73_10420 [Polyangiaceae bacterium]
MTTRGEVLVTLRGSGFGRLRVGAERRWVYGRFSRTFVVSKPAGSIEVEARWPFGRRIWSLSLERATDVRPPRLQPCVFRDPADSRRALVPAPRVQTPRFSPVPIPRSIALRVGREIESFESSSSCSV